MLILWIESQRYMCYIEEPNVVGDVVGGWQATGAFILLVSEDRLSNADVSKRFTLLQTWLSACYCF